MSSVVNTVSKTISDNYRELSRGGQVVKKIIMASNALVLLFGLLLVIVGGVAAGGQINALTSTTLASGIIVLGVFVMLVALLGCWGAMVENKIILYVYFGLLLFFAIIEFAVGIAAYVKKDDLPELTSQLWTSLYNQDTTAIDDIENTFQCCGWSNTSDRAVPPYGNEKTCSAYFADDAEGAVAPPCYTEYFVILRQQNMDTTSNETRKNLADFQEKHGCCGWTQLLETDNYWYPFSTYSNETCVSKHSFDTPCAIKIGNAWADHYAIHDDATILQYEKEEFGDATFFTCCGWQTVTDMPVPPYSNNTCLNVYNYTQPCAQAVDAALVSSLQITGGVGIALGILQIATIILTLVLIVKLPPGGAPRRHEEANAGVMEELHDEEN